MPGVLGNSMSAMEPRKCSDTNLCINAAVKFDPQFQQMLERRRPYINYFFHEIGHLATPKAQVFDRKKSKGSSYGDDDVLLLVYFHLECRYIGEMNLGMSCQDADLKCLYGVAEIQDFLIVSKVNSAGSVPNFLNFSTKSQVPTSFLANNTKKVTENFAL